MSGMHLLPLMYSTTGKKKGPKRFRNATAAQTAREDSQRWRQIKQQHGVVDAKKRQSRGLAVAAYVPPKLTYRGSELPHIPSLPSTWEACVKAPVQQYTGDAMIGIGTMHKSNMVPIFSQKEAEEIANMRRG